MTTKLRETPAKPSADRAHRDPVDPRIRRRRVEVSRAEGRRRLRLLLVLAAIVAMMAAAWGLSRSPLVNVDHVEVVGSSRTPVAEITRVAGVRRGQSMIDVDEDGAARRVSSLAWLAQARVRRDWPGSVTITVIERVPVAAVSTPGGFALVDSEARVLEIAPQQPPDLVTIVGLALPGPPGARLPEPGPRLLAVAKAVPGELKSRVAGVGLDPVEGIELLMNGGARLRVGTSERLGEKFQSALTVFARVNTGGMEVLDVRVPASPVLTRQVQEG